MEFSTKLTMVSALGRGFFAGLLIANFSVGSAAAAVKDSQPEAVAATFEPQGKFNFAAIESLPLTTPQPERVDFKHSQASPEIRRMANWVMTSGDNLDMPFLIVDKIEAKVFVFNALGQLQGAAAALLGSALGDDSVPGIGDRPLSNIRPEERTTPAGRFVAYAGRNLHGEEIIWVDYDAAISLHRVITSNLVEQRGQRLSSATPLDNRISYGCINVPVRFYDHVIHRTFAGTNGVVYVLPETR